MPRHPRIPHTDKHDPVANVTNSTSNPGPPKVQFVGLSAGVRCVALTKPFGSKT